MVVHHLLSRGIEAVQKYRDNEPLAAVQLPTEAVVVVVITIVIHGLIQLAAQYAYGLLIPVLVMTEAPSTTVVVKMSTSYRDDVEEEIPDAPLLSKEERETQLPQDEEVVIITHAPLTSRFRTILLHLKTKTQSRLSMYRAAGGYIVYSMLTGLAASVSRRMLWHVSYLAEIPLLACLAIFGAAWVQQAVAMPGKNYFQRVAELRKSGAFKKLFVPVLLVKAVERAVFSLPRNIVIATSAIRYIDNTRTLALTSVGIAIAGITFLTCLLAVVLPLNVALVRLQASMLPEETETVIPIDRSLGDAEVKDLRSAWKSFPRSGVWRLVKTWVKAAFLQMVLALIAISALIMQLRILAPDEFATIVENIRKEFENMQ